MICAKEYKLGFGGKNIPDIFWPSDDSISSLQEFIEELNAVLNLSKEEAEQKVEQLYQEELDDYRCSKAKKDNLRRIYRKMLAKVNAWTPPKKLKDFKKFIIEELEYGLEHDCEPSGEPPKKQSGVEYKEQAIEDAMWQIRCNLQEHTNELQRSKELTEWVVALRKSLAGK